MIETVSPNQTQKGIDLRTSEFDVQLTSAKQQKWKQKKKQNQLKNPAKNNSDPPKKIKTHVEKQGKYS